MPTTSPISSGDDLARAINLMCALEGQTDAKAIKPLGYYSCCVCSLLSSDTVCKEGLKALQGANRYTRPENLAWSHSVFIQYSLCITRRFMKPLLLSSIANTECLFFQSIPPSPNLNFISKSYHVNCPNFFYNLPCHYC